jgi:hypothetical protein
MLQRGLETGNSGSPVNARCDLTTHKATKVFAHGLCCCTLLPLASLTPPETRHKVSAIASVAKGGGKKSPCRFTGNDLSKLREVTSTIRNSSWHCVSPRHFQGHIFCSTVSVGGYHNRKSPKTLVQWIKGRRDLTDLDNALWSKRLVTKLHQDACTLGDNLSNDVAQKCSFARAWRAVHREEASIIP